ncbi:MAG: hypothetical protein KGS72_18070 [Cyanobacteria bacterium REEB67]|nr:hypothetical protein [Cyanobacteria bacterium REEB67]
MSNRQAHFTALFAAMYLSTVPAQSANTDVEGWELTQRVRLTGNIDVSICKTGVRLFVPENGLVIIAAAPWKEAYFYCKKTGNIYKTPFARVTNPYLKAMALWTGSEFSAVKVVLKGPVKSLGRPCLRYVEAPGSEQQLASQYKKGEIDGRAPKRLEYIVTNYFDTDPHVGWFIARFCTLPSTDRVPLQFKYTSVDEHSATELATYSCKRVKLKSTDFEPPHGLNLVNDSCQVLVPDNSEGSIDMMMGQTKIHH